MNSLCYFSQRFIFRRPFLVANVPNYDLRFRFKTEDCVGRTLYKCGIYEPYLTRWLVQHAPLSSESIVLDIGANLGWYSLLLAKKFQAQVYAFEPDPLNLRLLKSNIQRNKISGIRHRPNGNALSL